MKTRDIHDYIAAGLVTVGALIIASSCDVAHADTGSATYYTTASCKREGTSGVYTASGEGYNEAAMTCARPRRSDRGKLFNVVNPDTGASVVVRCNDFGPGKKARARGVVIDLTPAAYRAIGGSEKAGRVNVGIQEVAS